MRKPRAGSGARRILRDERGAAIVFVSVFLVAFVAFASLGVDLGALHLERRQQQGATDLAAAAAASDPSQATAAALANLVRNGYHADDLVSVVRGTYEPDSAVAAGSRFAPSSTGDAYEVTVKSTKDTLFVGLLSKLTAPASDPGLSGIFEIRTKAVAAADRRVAFAIGSRVLRLDSGVTNAVLSALSGSNLALDAADYEALASTRVDLFTLAERVASELSLGAVTYRQVANTDVRLGPAFEALLAAAQAGGASARALAALQRLADGTGMSPLVVDLNQLVNYGYSGARTVGSPPPIGVSIGALDLVTGMLQIANGTRQVHTALNVSLPGITSASVTIIFGQRPSGSSMVAVGREGAAIETAQARVLLNLTLPGSGLIASVQLPLYLEAARGTARLTAISCTPWTPTSSQVTLMVRPGVVDAKVGAITAPQFTALNAAPSAPAATLVQVSALQAVTGTAQVSWTNGAETAVSYTFADAAAGTKKTTTTTSPSTVVTTLVGSVTLGTLAPDLLGLQTLTRQILNTATPSIDLLMQSVLTALGANVGQVDTWLTGVRCGTSVLVR